MARFILLRLAEKLALNISFDPVVIIGGEVCTSSCHLNFSTSEMRGKGGIKYIKHAIELLSKSDHDILLRMYDPTIKEENKKRLRDMSNNYHPRMDEMLCNVGMKSRTTNIIPMLVNINGSGYFEDRRPPSHTDPYEAAEGIVKACVFGDLLMPEFKSLKNLTLLDHSNE